MDYLTNIKNKVNELKNSLADSDIGNIFVPENIREERLAICFSCDSLFKPTNQCKECGCVVKAKTRIAAFSCPLKKWSAHTLTPIPGNKSE